MPEGPSQKRTNENRNLLEIMCVNTWTYGEIMAKIIQKLLGKLQCMCMPEDAFQKQITEVIIPYERLATRFFRIPEETKEGKKKKKKKAEKPVAPRKPQRSNLLDPRELQLYAKFVENIWPKTQDW